MTWTWTDIPVLDIDAVDDSYVELPDSTLHAAVVLALGPEYAVRAAGNCPHDDVTIVCRDAAGVSEVTRPFSDEDRRVVGDGIDVYLLAAGGSARPRGFRWFVTLPPEFSTLDDLLTIADELQPNGQPTSYLETLCKRFNCTE